MNRNKKNATNVSRSSNFVKDDVYNIAHDCAENVLKDKVYDPSNANAWAKEVAGDIIEKLKEEQKGCKYIVDVAIFQKGIGTFHLSGQCLWNPTTDGNCQVPYENDSLHCYMTVYAVAI